MVKNSNYISNIEFKYIPKIEMSGSYSLPK